MSGTQISQRKSKFDSAWFLLVARELKFRWTFKWTEVGKRKRKQDTTVRYNTKQSIFTTKPRRCSLFPHFFRWIWSIFFLVPEAQADVGSPGLHNCERDVLALAWPESHGFGPLSGGFGSIKREARPKCLALAWPGLALAQAVAFPVNLARDLTKTPRCLLQSSHGGPKAMAFWPGFGLNNVQARPKATPGQDSGLALALVPKPKSHGFLA
ncbi:hypothetical protein DFH06DRAFT_1125239 [Mycena polygramma]|nr:hypothetical protein DFH06DRAFT_1125239 [Mycena polygramma]